ncbi:hypothetical protein ACQPZP_09300 [Spirillospora sp. CA-142024]|uniref:hypothetical protein n=1 Tax=Spirillospora sp. CA-142024 TaxID=3240036 RepID=UPI003D9298D6
MSAKPNNNLRLIAIVGAVVAAVGLLAGLAFATLTTNSDSDSEVHRPEASATAPAAQPIKIIATVDNGMPGNDRQFAMLEFEVNPEGGQITGTYTKVTINGSGKAVGMENPTQIGGTGGATTFKLQVPDGTVKGNLLGANSPGTILKFDRTFGVEKYDWTIISSAQEFKNTVTTYLQRFADCSKKHAVDPCEGVV